jgi:hypothetical protein
MVSQYYEGSLRPRVLILTPNRLLIQWVTELQDVVWEETANVGEGVAFVSQIECAGKFNVRPAYFVDGLGKRHFRMHAECGKIGAFGKDMGK